MVVSPIPFYGGIFRKKGANIKVPPPPPPQHKEMDMGDVCESDTYGLMDVNPSIDRKVDLH